MKKDDFDYTWGESLVKFNSLSKLTELGYKLICSLKRMLY